MSCTFLNALQLLTHLILTPILQIKHQYFYPHFTEKETKAQKVWDHIAIQIAKVDITRSNCLLHWSLLTTMLYCNSLTSLHLLQEAHLQSPWNQRSVLLCQDLLNSQQVTRTFAELCLRVRGERAQWFQSTYWTRPGPKSSPASEETRTNYFSGLDSGCFSSMKKTDWIDYYLWLPVTLIFIYHGILK